MRNRMFFMFILLFTCISIVYAQYNSKLYISDVKVEGGFSKSTAYIVEKNLGLIKGGVYNPSIVARGIKFLYKTDRFDDIKVLVRVKGYDSVDVRVVIRENPKIIKINIIGNHEIKDKDILDTIPLKKDGYLTKNGLFNSVKIITDLYNSKGYSKANVNYIIDFKNGDTTKCYLTFSIDEGNKVKIKKIRFVGNKSIPDGKLKKIMSLKEKKFWRFWGANFIEDSLKSDLEKIKNYYKDNGFLDVTIKDYKIKYLDNGNVKIEIDINEGNRYYFGNLIFKGNTIYDSLQLARATGIKYGKVYSIKKFKQAKYKISSLYAEKGYIYMNIKTKNVYRDSLVDIYFYINESYPAYIHKVIIKGNTKTKEFVIRRELRVKPGDIYRQSNIIRSQREIIQLNFFKNVIPDVVPYDSNSVDIVFKVEEKPTGQISLGAAYNTLDGLTGTFSLAIPNFRGNGQYLGINMEYGSTKRYYGFSFREPYLFWTPTSIGFSLYHEELYYNYMSRIRTGGSITGGRKLRWPDDYFAISLGYYLEKYTYFDISDYYLLRGYVPGSFYVSKIKMGIYRNSTDWPEFPTKGSFIGYYPELAGTILMGDKHYFKQTFIANLYFKSFWRFVFEVKNKFGYLIELPGNVDGNNLVSDFFLIGGSSWDGILRGYNDNSFGPGKVMYLVRLNYRFSIVEHMFYMGVFSDMGNVWKELYDVNMMDLKKSVGFGFRASIVGLGILGLDFAWGLDKYDSNQNNIIDEYDRIGGFRIHFQINQEF